MRSPGLLTALVAALLATGCVPAGSVLRAALFPSWALRHEFRATAPVLPQGGELLFVSTPEGIVEAFYLPAPQASAAQPAPLVVILHGNAETIDDRLGTAAQFQDLGMAVLLPEYRSYGRSGGTPSQAHISADLVRFYDAVVARPEVDASRVVLYGCSLGGGLAGALAGQRPPAALILTSTFASFRRLVGEFGVPQLVVTDRLDTEATLRELDAAVLIVHGRHDTLIGLEHAEALHAAARRAELVLHGGGHSCSNPWPQIGSFLQRHALVERDLATP